MSMTPVNKRDVPTPSDQPAATAGSKLKWHNKHVRILSLIPGASIAIARKVFKQKGTPATSSLKQDHSVQYLKSYSKAGAVVLAIPVIGNIFALFKIVGQGIGRALDTRATEELLKGLKGDADKFDVSTYKNMTPAQLAFAWKELAHPKNGAALTQEQMLANPSLKKLTEALIAAQPEEKRAEYVKQLLENLKDTLDQPGDKQLTQLVNWLVECSKLPKETIQMAVLQAKWTYVEAIPVKVRWEFDKAPSQPGEPPESDFVHALRYLAAYEDNPYLHMGFTEHSEGILNSKNIEYLKTVDPNDPAPIRALQEAVKIKDETSFSGFFAAHGEALLDIFFHTLNAVSDEKELQGMSESAIALDRIEFAGMLLRQCPQLSMVHKSYLLNQIVEDFAIIDKKHPTENQLRVLSQVLMEFNQFTPKDLSLEDPTLSEKFKAIFKKTDHDKQIALPSKARFKNFFEEASGFIEKNKARLKDENDQKRVALLEHVKAKAFESDRTEAALGTAKPQVSISSKLDKILANTKKATQRLMGKEVPISPEEFNQGKLVFVESLPKQAALLLDADAFHTWIQANKQYMTDPQVKDAVSKLIGQLPSEMQITFLRTLCGASIEQSKRDMDQKTDAEQQQEMALASFFSGLFVQSAPDDMILALSADISNTLAGLEGQAALQEFVNEGEAQPQVQQGFIAGLKNKLEAREEAGKAAKAEKAELSEREMERALKVITRSVPAISEAVTEGLEEFKARELLQYQAFNTAAREIMMRSLSEKDVREDLKSWLSESAYSKLFDPGTSPEEACEILEEALKSLEGKPLKPLVAMRNALQEIGKKQSRSSALFLMESCLEFQENYATQISEINQMATTIAAQKKLANKALKAARAAVEKQEKAKNKDPEALSVAHKAFETAQARVNELQEAETEINVAKQLLEKHLEKTKRYAIDLTDEAACFEFARFSLDPSLETFFRAIENPALDAAIKPSMVSSSKARLAQELTQLVAASVSQELPAEKPLEDTLQSLLTCPLKDLPGVIEPLLEAAYAQVATVHPDSAEAEALDDHIDHLESLVLIAKYGKPLADFISQIPESEKQSAFYQQILKVPPDQLAKFIADSMKKGQKALQEAPELGLPGRLKQLQKEQIALETIQTLLKKSQFPPQNQTLSEAMRAAQAGMKETQAAMKETQAALTTSFSSIKEFLTRNQKTGGAVFRGFNLKTTKREHFQKAAYARVEAHNVSLARQMQPLKAAIAKEKAKAEEQGYDAEASAELAAVLGTPKKAAAVEKTTRPSVNLPALEARLAELQAAEGFLAQYKAKIDLLKDELQILTMQPATDEYSKIDKDHREKIEALIQEIAQDEGDYQTRFKDYSPPVLRFSQPQPLAKKAPLQTAASFSEDAGPKTPTEKPQAVRAASAPPKTPVSPTSTSTPKGNFRERAAEKLRRRKQG